jgi:hypothetical protein
LAIDDWRLTIGIGSELGRPLSYSVVFCHEKQENLAILHLCVYPSVIPARFWPESRNTPEWIPAKGMPEGRDSTLRSWLRLSALEKKSWSA